MGSHPVLAVVPQQELPPDFTRSAAWPYFSLTTSFISLVSIPASTRLIGFLLPANSDDLFGLHCLVASTALGVEELQQLLQAIGIGCVAQECPLTLHFY